MFWGDLGEAQARQNLRNGLHRLKKLMPFDVFNTSEKTQVSICTEASIWRDTDALVETDGEQLLKIKSVIFMENLYLRDTLGFDKWTTSMRNAYERIVIDRLEGCMREMLRTGSNSVSAYAQKLLDLSPYHEEACRVLMQHYSNLRMYSDAILLYTKLKIRLEEDLSLEPEHQTQQLYNTIINMRYSESCSVQNEGISQRHIQAHNSLLQEYNRFLLGKRYQHCIIQGAVGTGKSQIINDFLQTISNGDLLRLRFKMVDSSTPFHAIGRVLAIISEACELNLAAPDYSDFQSLMLYQIISMDKLITQVKSKGIRMLLILENIEAIDDYSMEIIISHLLCKCCHEIMVIGEFCTSFSSERRKLVQMNQLDNLCFCCLTPLSLQETVTYFSKQLDYSPCSLDYTDIWEKTGGVPMFLEDVIGQIQMHQDDWYQPSTSTRRKIFILLYSLNQDERDCLELMSIFRYGVTIQDLSAITGKQAVSLADISGKLQRRQLISEEDFEGHLLARVSTEMLREIIYSEISRLKRVEIHRISAQHFQNSNSSLHRDYHLLRELTYHFQQAGMQYESIYYALHKLWYRLDYCDEFFPTIHGDPNLLDTIYLSRIDTYSEFTHFERQLGRLSNYLQPEQMLQSNIIFDYLKGRTLIRDSHYSEGLSHIQQLIKSSTLLKRYDMQLKGYLEMVFIGLKTENEPLMREYIGKARKIPTFHNYNNEKGILLRLEAMCDIMTRNYERAEHLLHQSIKVLESPQLCGYSCVNVAAAYDYLGSVYRLRMDYDRSKEYLELAISMCLRHNLKKRLDLFYEDLGYTMFLQGDYNGAKECFQKSEEIYNFFDNYWRRSIGASCMAMIYAYEKKSELAMEYLRRAEIFSTKDNTNEEQEILSQARRTLESANMI